MSQINDAFGKPMYEADPTNVQYELITTAEKRGVDKSKEELNAANERIKRLEEDLMDAKNKHAALVADVALYEDRGERIKRLEDIIKRASNEFFRDASDNAVANGMLTILEEVRKP